MADIFISYKREDYDFAQRLAYAFEQLGFDVWWDLKLRSGDRFQKVVREVINNCSAAVVLWSVGSVESEWVIDESAHAKSLGKLCPARIDEVKDLPYGFGQIQTDDLSGWDGDIGQIGFSHLVQAIEVRVGRKARLGRPVRTPASQVQDAELEAFQSAQLAGNASALKAFLKQFPRGNFAGFVHSQIETMDAHAPDPQVVESGPPKPPPSEQPAAQEPPVQPRPVTTNSVTPAQLAILNDEIRKAELDLDIVRQRNDKTRDGIKSLAQAREQEIQRRSLFIPLLIVFLAVFVITGVIGAVILTLIGYKGEAGVLGLLLWVGATASTLYVGAKIKRGYGAQLRQSRQESAKSLADLEAHEVAVRSRIESLRAKLPPS